MHSKPYRIRPYGISFLLIAFLLTLPLIANDQLPLLNNDWIINMVRWNANETEIISIVDRNNDTNFDLSASTVAVLKSSGVSDKILDAMWRATLRSLKSVPANSAAASTPPASAHTASAPNKPIAEPSTERLKVARGEDKLGEVPPYLSKCLPLGSSAKEPSRIGLHWNGGTATPSRVDHSGTVCFELQDFNDILYTPGVYVTEKPVEGSAFDLLKDAIGKLPSLATGGVGQDTTDTTKAKDKQTTTKSLVRPTCPPDLVTHTTAAVEAGGAFQVAVDQLSPGKDSSGKVNYVDLQITQGLWPEIEWKYGAFEEATLKVVSDLRDSNADVCTNAVLGPAETLVVDSYTPVKKRYRILLSHAKSDHIVRFSADLDSTSAYEITVKPLYGGAETVQGSKAFHLAAGHKTLNSSVGFLITELPARNYSSRTAPAGTNNSTVQNVLGVDFSSGPRIALAALLNYHPPLSFLDRRHYGLAVSAGPVFDVSGGKADTSRFGFFGGTSLRLGNYVYLTPGVHVGEFADFPQGFTAPGQVIPPNTGTPQPLKRYTARFAVGITFKLKDLGEPSTKPISNPAAPTPGNSGAGKPGSGGSDDKVANKMPKP